MSTSIVFFKMNIYQFLFSKRIPCCDPSKVSTDYIYVPGVIDSAIDRLCIDPRDRR